MSVKNKTCYICKCAENRGTTPHEHACSINHTGSSSSMEAKSILEGFQSSVVSRGVRYLFLIADGDSSVYQNILADNPYGDVNLMVTKIECKNHILRCLCRNLQKFANSLSGRRQRDPVRNGEFIILKSFISKKIFSLRMGIDRACTFRGKSKENLKESTALLHKDIVNAPRHVFGDHDNCANYFCNGELKEDTFNAVPTLQALGVFDKIMELVLRVAANADSLIHNINNNVVESFNSTLMHSTGKKVINYTSRFGYQGRSSRGLLQFNEMDSYRILHKHLKRNASPDRVYKKYKANQIRKRLNNRKSTKHTKWNFTKKRSDLKTTSTSGDKFYGSNSQQPDMDIRTYKIAATQVLESFRITPEEIKSLEERTRGQANSSEWYIQRKKRLIAINFKKYCAMRETTSSARLVGEIVCSTFFGNAATDYGKDKEPLARALLERKMNNIKIRECGFYVHPIYTYLGASPDGELEDTNTLIEIKCPASLPRDQTLKECMTKQHSALKFWKSGQTSMHWNHAYYYQVQGQLKVTDKEKCIFAVFKETELEGEIIEELEYEIITRDKDFWNTSMLPKLQKFIFNCLLPELVDSCHKRSMNYRDVNIHGKEVSKKPKKS